MVSGFVFENAKAEKLADAMWSSEYGRRRKFWKFLPFIEALVAVIVLLSWLTPPLAAVKYLRQLAACCLNGGIFIFALVNFLIAVIFSLSHLMKPIDSDLHDQYISASAASTAVIGGSSTVSGSVALCEVDNSKLYPVVSNTVQISPAKQAGPSVLIKHEDRTCKREKNDVNAVTTTAKTEINCPVREPLNAVRSAREFVDVRREMVRAVSSVGGETGHIGEGEMTVLPSAEESRIYRRTRSERMDRREERRRIGKWSDMDELSSEEFRTTIETFIAAKKKEAVARDHGRAKRKADVAKKFR